MPLLMESLTLSTSGSRAGAGKALPSRTPRASSAARKERERCSGMRKPLDQTGAGAALRDATRSIHSDADGRPGQESIGREKEQGQAGGDGRPVVEMASVALPRAVLALDRPEVSRADLPPIELAELRRARLLGRPPEAVQGVERVRKPVRL